jgi:atrial natriuretic peptide receptor B
MSYLHTTKVFSHGDLSAHTVLIDSRFVVKITDFGMSFFRPMDDLAPPDEDDEDRDFGRLLWRAPELLRRPILGGSQKGQTIFFSNYVQENIQKVFSKTKNGFSKKKY